MLYTLHFLHIHSDEEVNTEARAYITKLGTVTFISKPIQQVRN